MTAVVSKSPFKNVSKTKKRKNSSSADTSVLETDKSICSANDTLDSEISFATPMKSKKQKKSKKSPKHSENGDISAMEVDTTQDMTPKKSPKDKKSKKSPKVTGNDSSVLESQNLETLTPKKNKKKKHDKSPKISTNGDTSILNSTQESVDMDTTISSGKKHKKSKKSRKDEDAVENSQNESISVTPKKAKSKKRSLKESLNGDISLADEETTDVSSPKKSKKARKETPTVDVSLLDADFKMTAEDLKAIEESIEVGKQKMTQKPKSKKTKTIKDLAEIDESTAGKKFDLEVKSTEEDGEEEPASTVEEEKEKDKVEAKEVKKTSLIKPSEDLNNEKTVRVTNVPLDTKTKDIVKFFKQYGKVEGVRFREIPVADADKFKIKQINKKKFQKGRFSMVAYVKFSSEAEAKASLDANNKEFNKRHIFVKPSVLKEDLLRSKKAFTDGCTVFIGNLPYNAEEEKLHEILSPCGNITNINIARKKLVCIGVAFVTFDSKEAVAKAIKMNETQCMNRKLRITKAVRKIKKQNLPQDKKGGPNNKNKKTNKKDWKNKKNNKKAAPSFVAKKSNVKGTKDKKDNVTQKQTFSGENSGPNKETKQKKKRPSKGDFKKKIISKTLKSAKK